MTSRVLPLPKLFVRQSPKALQQMCCRLRLMCSTGQDRQNNRNPFWPIGWKPSARVAGPNSGDHAGPDIPASAFLVSSITLSDKTRFAIVNGKVMQEGQQFGLQIGAQTYQITLKAVQDGRVIFSRRDQEIVVPLRRK